MIDAQARNKGHAHWSIEIVTPAGQRVGVSCCEYQELNIARVNLNLPDTIDGR